MMGIGTALLFIIFITLFQITKSSSAAGTETLLGVVGRDFIILGADSSSSSNIALTASNLDKIFVVVDPQRHRRQHHSPISNDEVNDKNDGDTDATDTETLNVQRKRSRQQQAVVAAAAGDAADADKLLGQLSAHAAIREYEAGVGCDVECVFDGSSSSSSIDGIVAETTTTSADAGLDATAVAHLARGQISSSLRSGNPARVCLLIAGMVRCRGDLESDGLERMNLELEDIEDDLLSDDVGDGDVVAKSGSFPYSRRIQMQVEAAVDDLKYDGKKALVDENGVNDEGKAPLARSSSSLPFLSARRAFLKPRLFWLDEYGSLQKMEYGAHGFAANFALSILDQGYRDDLTREEAAELIRGCFDQLRERYVINSPQPPCIKCVDANGCHIIR
mmetsp:Transcript_5675/g.7096  ORF Transcript_5675/g.7096 Transcript_5675/m.7096 type:complete len:391 (-) Transcript_5675:61-1233(-)|eukprot:CAMPEP_0172507398 /NCGR_PEP_ID=MMETSP1066-20121228/203393_1 /TAXON_ID=671091 /ORGANISM="Coscinodiscus wailesii, Strain CCMP2513" /LENGTH=390 /DNA_ID=CAMNT_0013284939 /DNA_START=84 /DNA_END=1256 /DNA_ORIENTATION=+